MASLEEPAYAPEQERSAPAEVQATVAAVTTPLPAAVLALQRSAGNAATARLLARSPATVADDVIAKEDQPDPIAGLGDYQAAFDLLIPLDSDELLQVLHILQQKFRLELLRDRFGAARSDRDRLQVAIAVVFFRFGALTPDEVTLNKARLKTLDAGVQAAVRRYLTPMPAHKREAMFDGEEAELDRLAGVEAQFWEDKRKAAEAEARRQQEEEAKKRGLPPPAAAPKVDVGDVLDKEVKERRVQPIPTAQWDNLSPKDKDNWTNTRAPAAFAKLTASIKGTELENVMKGHTFVFEPRKMLERGGYAYQDGPALVGGMAFIKDIEADPKNVWGIVAHEIGGHFEYGETYGWNLLWKAIARLPEAEQKKWKDPKNVTGLYDAFSYAETEIYAALRQRRYDVPEKGPAPTHGAIKPDDNIEGRLKSVDAAFPKEVGTAILVELNAKVQAAAEILPRDKQYFLDQASKHGYTLQ